MGYATHACGCRSSRPNVEGRKMEIYCRLTFFSTAITVKRLNTLENRNRKLTYDFYSLNIW